MSTANISTTQEYYIAKHEGIDNLVLRTTSLAPLKEHEVLVKIHSVALNYRDVLIITGKYPAGFGLKENVVPCSDMGGQVFAVGEAVTKWKIGDRVTSSFFLNHIYGEPNLDAFGSALGGPVDGVLTEYRAFPEQALVAIPDKLSYDEAAALPCAGITAYNALFGSVPLKGGDSVLIQGTGGVSLLGLQMAVAAGAFVIVTSSSDAKLEIAKNLGAKHTINYKTVPEWDEEVLKLTNGVGVDYVLEVGGEGTLGRSLRSLRIGGHVPIVGFLAGPGNIGSLPHALVIKAANLRGIPVGHRGHLESLIKLISATDMKPYVDRIFKFNEAKAAFSHLEKQAHVGKVVIRVAED